MAYLNAPISIGFGTDSWPPIGFAQYGGYAGSVSAPPGQIPKSISTAWAELSFEEQVRYDYEFVSGGIEFFCPYCEFLMARGFETIAPQCPVCYEGKMRAIPSAAPTAIWIVSAGAWGTKRFEEYAATELSDYWRLKDLSLSYTSIAALLAEFSIAIGSFPQDLNVSLTIPLTYRRRFHDVLLGWDNFGPWESVDESMVQAMVPPVTLESTPVPAPNPIIVASLSYASVQSGAQVDPDQPIGLHLVLRKNVPVELEPYPTSVGHLVVLCNGHIIPIWSDIFRAGTPEATEVVLDVQFPSSGIDGFYGQTITETTSMQVYPYAGNGPSYSTGDVATESYVWWAFVEVLEHYGTISVTGNLAGATFTLTGPKLYTGKVPQSIPNAPLGTYTIAWGAMPGYKTPAGSSKALADLATIGFVANYEPGSGDGGGTELPVGAMVAGAAGVGLLAWAMSKRRK